MVKSNDKPSSYVDYTSGEPIYLKIGDTFIDACCDCYLVHCTKITQAKDGRLILRSWRNNRRTAQIRRHRGNPLKKHD